MVRPSREYAAFVKLTDKLLSVPRAEVQKRLDAYKERAAQNPNRRGPKRKAVMPSDESHDASGASQGTLGALAALPSQVYYCRMELRKASVALLIVTFWTLPGAAAASNPINNLA